MLYYSRRSFSARILYIRSPVATSSLLFKRELSAPTRRGGPRDSPIFIVAGLLIFQKPLGTASATPVYPLDCLFYHTRVTICTCIIQRARARVPYYAYCSSIIHTGESRVEDIFDGKKENRRKKRTGIRGRATNTKLFEKIVYIVNNIRSSVLYSAVI